MTRLLFALVCTLAVASASSADYAVGYTEDGYSYAGSGYWRNTYGDYFTREEVNYTGYKTYYQYGYAYQQPVNYYYWRYVRKTKPLADITPKSTESERIDFLKQRERIAGQIAKGSQETRDHLAWLDKIGVTPPFPGMDGYGEAFSYRQAYVPPLQGQTVYTITQTADLYQPVDVNAAIQAMSLAGKWSQESTREAGQSLAGVTRQILESNERVALAREDRIRVLESLRLTQPPSRITTTVTGPPKAFPPTEPPPHAVGASVVTTSCIACHTGAKAAGKLDMSRPLTEAQQIEMLRRVTLPVTDRGHMPQTSDGVAGRQMTASEIARMAAETAKASVAKP